MLIVIASLIWYTPNLLSVKLCFYVVCSDEFVVMFREKTKYPIVEPAHMVSITHISKHTDAKYQFLPFFVFEKKIFL